VWRNAVDDVFVQNIILDNISEIRARIVDNSNGGVFSVNVTEKELADSEWAMLLCLRG
jgi:hypothetical protein